MLMDMFVFVVIGQMDENMEVLPVMFVTAWYVIGVIFWRKMTFESMWLQYRQNLGCRLIS